MWRPADGTLAVTARVVRDAERSALIALQRQGEVESSQRISPANGGGNKLKQPTLSQVRADGGLLFHVHPVLWDRDGAPA
jgi:hypothetical protein